MPSPRVSPVTRPNSVSTPTLPVGIEVVLQSSSNTSTIAIPQRKIREPARRKFSIPPEPPRSMVPRVTLTIQTPPQSELLSVAVHYLLSARGVLDVSRREWRMGEWDEHDLNRECGKLPLYVVVFML